MRAALAALLLLSCATPPPPPPPPAPARAEVPEDLRRCAAPVPPPAVPPRIRSPEKTDAYAWAEARARWQTADLLRACSAKLARLNEWIAAQH